jgi:hypothetical protein
MWNLFCCFCLLHFSFNYKMKICMSSINPLWTSQSQKRMIMAFSDHSNILNTCTYSYYNIIIIATIDVDRYCFLVKKTNYRTIIIKKIVVKKIIINSFDRSLFIIKSYFIIFSIIITWFAIPKLYLDLKCYRGPLLFFGWYKPINN